MADILDYSSGRPTAQAMIAAGYGGAVRYVGTRGNAKNLTRAEAYDILNNGLDLGFVYETGAGWALGGYAVGQGAARAALADLASMDIRPRCVFYAVDVDVTDGAQMAAVASTLDGAANVSGRELVGVYGEADVIDAMISQGHATWGWQTRAWSGGRVSSRAHLLQQIGGVTVDGIACDRNTVLKEDWGQIPAPGGMHMDADVAAKFEALDAKLDKIGQLITVGDAKNNAGTETHPDSLETVRNKLDSALSALAALKQDVADLRVGSGDPGAVADALEALIARLRVSVAP